MCMTKKSFIEATRGKMNQTVEWNGFQIHQVGWLDYGWKLMDKNGAMLAAPFRTREDLWNHLKTI